MPTVPIAQNMISTDVPGAQIPQNSYVNEAVGKLAGTVAQIGVGLLTEVKKSQAQTESSQAYYQHMQELQDKQLELKLSSPDGMSRDSNGEIITNTDGTQKTITQEFSEFANEKFNGHYENLSSAMAQEAFQQRAYERYNVDLSAMKNLQLEKGIENTKNVMSQNQQQSFDIIASTPSIPDTYQRINDLSHDVMVQTVFDPNQKHDQVVKIEENAAVTHIGAETNNILAGVKSNDPNFDRVTEISKVRALLSGDVTKMDATAAQEYARRKSMGLKTLDEMLTPEKKLALDRHLIELEGTAKKLDASDWKKSAEDIGSAAGRGTLNPIVGQAWLAKGAALVKAGSITQFEYAEKFGEISSDLVIGDLRNNPSTWLAKTDEELLKTVPQAGDLVYKAAQSLNVSSELYTGEAGARLRQHTEDKVEAFMKSEIIHARQENFPKYLATQYGTSKNPLVPSVAKALNVDHTNPVALEKNMGVIRQANADIKKIHETLYPGQPYEPLEKGKASEIAQVLKDPHFDANRGVKLINALGHGYGTNQVMSQLVNENGVSDAFRYVPYQSQYLAQVTAFRAAQGTNEKDMSLYKIQFGATAEKELDEALANNGGVKKEIRALELMNPGQGSTAMKTSGLITGIKSQAMLMKKANPNLSAEESVSAAYQAHVGRNVKYLETGTPGIFGTNTGLNSLPPKVAGYAMTDQMVDAQKQYLNSMQTPDNLKKLGVTPPPGVPADIFYAQIANKGRWVYQPNDTYIYMYQLDSPQGPAKPVAATMNNKKQLFSVPAKKAIEEGIRIQKTPGMFENLLKYKPKTSLPETPIVPGTY